MRSQSRVIARHRLEVVDPEGEKRRIGEGIEHALERVERFPRRLKRVLQSSLRWAGLCSYWDRDADNAETRHSYAQVVQASSAIFAVATATEGTVEIRFGDRVFELPAGSTWDIADPGTWVTAFYFAAICRDHTQLNALSTVPVDMLRSAGAVYDDYIYHWVDTLQTFWSQGPGLAAKLQSTLEAADPARIRYTPSDLLLGVLCPPIDLFQRFLAEQHSEFATGLARALQSHDTYFDSDIDDRRHSRAAMIAAGPLAMACLAYDAGFAVDVESDYLPRQLVQRRPGGVTATS